MLVMNWMSQPAITIDADDCVEDAVRLLCHELERDHRIGDFRVIASHQESLHSHDAVSILTSGETFAQNSFGPRLCDTLYHVG